MPLPTRNLLLVLLLSAATGCAWAQEGHDGQRVHRTPTWTAGGADSCLACHAGERMRAVAASAHGAVENPLTPYARHGCESCHGPGSIHVSRAHGGTGFPPLTVFGGGQGADPRDRQLAACLGCHDGADGGLAPTVFTGTAHDRRFVNCSSCHRVHVEQDPVLDRPQQAATCLRCHAAMEEGHRPVGNRLPDFGRVGCAGCHRVHRVKKSAAETPP